MVHYSNSLIIFENKIYPCFWYYHNELNAELRFEVKLKKCGRGALVYQTDSNSGIVVAK